MLAFELNGATKRFGDRIALNGVSLALPVGASLGLLGPNGAGKTTVLRLLLGMARPTSGSVKLQELNPEQPAARRRVGVLPERLVLPPRMTVSSFLGLHGRLAGVPKTELDREVERVAVLTGIADRRSDLLGGLSKGLAQRVGFAQAFIGHPRLLLLDEPTSGLDPIGMREARDWISAARAEGCTVLVSSHVLSEVERTCDRVAILNQGKLLVEGPIGDVVRKDEQLEDAFVRIVRGD